MRVFLTAVAFALVPAAAWTGLGLPNELVDPGFESGGMWTVSR